MGSSGCILHLVWNIFWLKFCVWCLDNPYEVMSSPFHHLGGTHHRTKVRITQYQLFIGDSTLYHPIIIMTFIFNFLHAIRSLPSMCDFLNFLLSPSFSKQDQYIVHNSREMSVFPFDFSVHDFEIQQTLCNPSCSCFELSSQRFWFTLLVH